MTVQKKKSIYIKFFINVQIFLINKSKFVLIFFNLLKNLLLVKYQIIKLDAFSSSS